LKEFQKFLQSKPGLVELHATPEWIVSRTERNLCASLNTSGLPAYSQALN